MKIRVIHDSTNPSCSRIEDAETGEPIHGVRVVRFEHAAGSRPTLTLDLVKDFTVDVLAEGELEDVTEVGDRVRRMRLKIPAPAGQETEK